MQIEVVGVRFKHSNNTYSFSPNGLKLKKGQKVLVESEKGSDIALVVEEKKLIDPTTLSEGLKNVIRVASDKEISEADKNDEIAKSYFKDIVSLAKKMQLEMKIISVEGNWDLSKLTVNFTAEDRVDFRAFAKKLAEKYKTKIELRQIGPRDAVRIMGGLGLCGKECCCSQGYGDCEHVSIKMAKNQNLSLNPNSISGICGKLLCCLNYENQNYVEALKQFPKVNSFVKTPEGQGKVMFNDLFKKLVSVRLEKDGMTEIKDFDLKDLKFEKNDRA